MIPSDTRGKQGQQGQQSKASLAYAASLRPLTVCYLRLGLKTRKEEKAAGKVKGNKPV